jgi:hypothetical protein
MSQKQRDDWSRQIEDVLDRFDFEKCISTRGSARSRVRALRWGGQLAVPPSLAPT